MAAMKAIAVLKWKCRHGTMNNYLNVSIHTSNQVKMNSSAWRRLQFEYENWHLTNLRNISANPIRNADESYNFFEWESVVNGQNSTGLETEQFYILLTFNENYPSHPPKCIFKLPIFHPNVTITGEIWSNLLRNKKSRVPPLTVQDVLSDIQHIIYNPEVHNIANIDPGYLYLSNKDTFWEVIKKYGFISSSKHEEYLQTLIKQECDNINRFNNSKKREEVENEFENVERQELEIKPVIDLGNKNESENMNKNEIEENIMDTENIEDNDFVSVFSDNDNNELFFDKMEKMLDDLETFIDNKLDAYLTEFRIYAREVNARKDENRLLRRNECEGMYFNLNESEEVVNKEQFQSFKPSQDSLIFDQCSTKLTQIQDVLQKLEVTESPSCGEEKQLNTSTDSTDSSNITEFYVPISSNSKICFETQDNMDEAENLLIKHNEENIERTEIKDQDEGKCDEAILKTMNTNQTRFLDKRDTQNLKENMVELSEMMLAYSSNNVNKEEEDPENKVFAEMNNESPENEEVKDVNVNLEEEDEPEIFYMYGDDEDDLQIGGNTNNKKELDEWIWKL